MADVSNGSDGLTTRLYHFIQYVHDVSEIILLLEPYIHTIHMCVRCHAIYIFNAYNPLYRFMQYGSNPTHFDMNLFWLVTRPAHFTSLVSIFYAAKIWFFFVSFFLRWKSEVRWKIRGGQLKASTKTTLHYPKKYESGVSK